MSSFNIVDENWLPVLDRNGIRHEISLRELLVKAHEFKEINGDSSCMSIALNRFL